MPASRLLIRTSTSADLPAITAIYGLAVSAGTGTFELEPPALDEMARRHAELLARGLPWLVAEVDAKVLGYACAQPFRPRPGYRYSLEDSVYLHPDAQRRGVGRMLLCELIGRAEALGARQMLAVIGDADNHGSVALHRALGFHPVGTFKDVGRKFERWLDVVLMQRALGAGATTAPLGAGATTAPLGAGATTAPQVAGAPPSPNA
jgi:phosphinothricin acetyltransferase